MKYKDLIEKLLPFADEEINMASNSEEFYYSSTSDEPVYGDRKYTVDEVRFYHPFEDNNDMIVGVRMKYDNESLESIEEAEIINPL
jgi:hypothetical protein